MNEKKEVVLEQVGDHDLYVAELTDPVSLNGVTLSCGHHLNFNDISALTLDGVTVTVFRREWMTVGQSRKTINAR